MSSRPVRPLLLGEGWFPDHPGGLNRYLAGTALRARGDRARRAPVVLVAGPLRVPGSVEAAVPRTRRCPAGVGFALRARRRAAARRRRRRRRPLRPLRVVAGALGGLRRLPLVVHFHGPWADESAASGGHAPARGARPSGPSSARLPAGGRVVVLSAAFKRLLVERYGVAPWRRPGDPARRRPGPLHARPPTAPGGGWVSTPTPGGLHRPPPRPPDGPATAARRLGAACRRDARRAAADRRRRARAADSSCRRAAGWAGATRSAARGGRRGRSWSTTTGPPTCASCPRWRLEGFGLVVAGGAGVRDAGGRHRRRRTARGAWPGLDPALVVPPGDRRRWRRGCSTALDGAVPAAAARAARTPRPSAGRAAAARQPGRLRRRPSAPRRPSDRRARRLPRPLRASCPAPRSRSPASLPALDVDAHVVLAEDGPLVGAPARRRACRSRCCRWPARPLAAVAARVSPGRAALVGSPSHGRALRRRLAARLRRLRPDLVHTNSLKAALYGGLAGRGSPACRSCGTRGTGSPTTTCPAPPCASSGPPPAVLPAAVLANSQATADTLGLAGRAAGTCRRRSSAIPTARRRPASRRPRPEAAPSLGRDGRPAGALEGPGRPARRRWGADPDGAAGAP